jgi:hypothetical protein
MNFAEALHDKALNVLGLDVEPLSGRRKNLTLAKIFQPTTSTLLADGTLVVERHEIFDDWTRVRNEWLIIRNSSAMRFKFHHTVYSGQELRDRMEHAGFVGVTLHGNLDGDEYAANAERLIAIGRKPISKHREKGPNGASRNTE